MDQKNNMPRVSQHKEDGVGSCDKTAALLRTCCETLGVWFGPILPQINVGSHSRDRVGGVADDRTFARVRIKNTKSPRNDKELTKRDNSMPEVAPPCEIHFF